MKRTSQQAVPETTDQYETTAELLEDLAAHADCDQERRRCLAAARNFRRAAQSTASRKRSKGEPQPRTSRHKSSSGGQHG